jgi:anti-sigma B factor antagonist
MCLLRWAGPHVVIVTPAEIDDNNAEQVGGVLLRALDEGPAALIVDMTATTFCAVAGIHILNQARRRADITGSRLPIVVSAPVVLRVLEIAGLAGLAEIRPSVDAALAALPAAGDGNRVDHRPATRRTDLA